MYPAIERRDATRRPFRGEAMTAGPIGVFAFWGNPTEHMPAARTRALIAEAALQEVDLCFFSPDDCDRVSGIVTATRWRRGGWERVGIELPGLVTVIGMPVLPQHRAVDDWLRSRTEVAGFRNRDKRKADALIARTRWARHVIPSDRLSRDAPETHLAEWLAGGGIVVKPNDGTLGRGIHMVVPDGDAFAIVRVNGIRPARSRRARRSASPGSRRTPVLSAMRPQIFAPLTGQMTGLKERTPSAPSSTP